MDLIIEYPELASDRNVVRAIWLQKDPETGARSVSDIYEIDVTDPMHKTLVEIVNELIDMKPLEDLRFAENAEWILELLDTATQARAMSYAVRRADLERSRLALEASELELRASRLRMQLASAERELEQLKHRAAKLGAK